MGVCFDGSKKGMLMSDVLGIFSCIEKLNSARLLFSERGYENIEMKGYNLEKNSEINENAKIYTVFLAHMPITERTLIDVSFDVDAIREKCQ